MRGTLLTLLVASISFTRTVQFEWGPCGSKPVQQNFSLSEYLGTWYEIERSGKSSETGKCISEKYKKEGNRVELLTQVIRDDGSVEMFEGELMFPSSYEKERAKFFFRVSSGGYNRWSKMRFDFPEEVPMPYWVLATDYTSYSLVYSCTSFLALARHVYIWILSRERQLSENTTNYLHDIMISNNIKTNDIIQSNQKDCPKFTV